MTQDILMSNDEPMATNDASRNQLKQYCSAAKTSQGAQLLEVIRQVLEAPSTYVFGELLALQNVQELKDGPHSKYLNTLNLFAYGTYKQYRQQPSEYLELTATMQKKLQHLTIVSLAIKNKCIPYEVLLEELDIDNVRHLEDVIIEAIYADIIHGKLFQNNRFLEIDYAQGRDIPPGYTSKIAKTLQQWVDSCDAISNCIDVQITRANFEKAKSLKNKDHIEQEIINLKKVLKTQITDNDDSMQIDTRESSSMDIRRKPFKTKSSRLHHAPSGKLTGMASSSADASGNVASGNAATVGGGVSGATSVTMAAANTTTSWLKSFTQSFDKE
ncbi:COP9 signalosome complex subunit 7 isoform X1 [Anastrepha ludens]|uniref:COP9 signalosome complex subunit 7 isoform X1 n=1 Tax=Anastrepha ludens TaxID=28586 RepID=UPI0023B1812D|nr:COP9 signalosome complex subunit 7 isoform X1 [Anastrepha ludens]